MADRMHLAVDGPTPPLGIELERVGDTLVVYVRVASGSVSSTREIQHDVLADYDAEGKLLGFELIAPKKGQSGAVLGWIRTHFQDQAPGLQLLEELVA